MGVQSQKNHYFANFGQFPPNCPRERPQYAARRRNFQKSLRTIVVLRLGQGIIRLHHVFEPKPRCPVIFRKKACRVGQKRHFLDVLWWGITVFAQKRSFAPAFSLSDAELQQYVKVFENSSVGPHTRAISAHVWTKIT